MLAIAWLVGTCSYIVSILIAMQYIGQLASRPWWQAWLGSIYPVLGVVTLVLLAVVNLRVRAAGTGLGPALPCCRRSRAIAVAVLAHSSPTLSRDTGVRCAGLRAGHEVLDRRT